MQGAKENSTRCRQHSKWWVRSEQYRQDPNLSQIYEGGRGVFSIRTISSQLKLTVVAGSVGVLRQPGVMRKPVVMEVRRQGVSPLIIVTQ